jgi:hypothetical protein
VSDTTGFTRIYTPGSLAGWDGNPKFWSARGDTLIAKSTPENVVDVNTFLIYRGDQNLRDFEFKTEYRFPTLEGNSGVQIRSAVRPGAPDAPVARAGRVGARHRGIQRRGAA